MEKIYYCESCGGVMEFDVETQSLKCPNCDTVVSIENDASRIEEHQLTEHVLQSIRAEEKTTHTMECQGCGAKIEVEATSAAAECPYCGANYVLAQKQEDAIIPDGVLPFQIDKKRVGELFQSWIKGRWLAPKALKHLYQRDRLQGIYLPYWTFDAKADGRYTAQGGLERKVTRRDAEGKIIEETVTDWFPTAGGVRQNFDDILVPASDKLNPDLLKWMDSFDLKQVTSYAPEYLSGYGAECYTVALQDAHRKAVHTVEEELKELARKDVLSRYDDVRSLQVQVNFREETYKHVLLPIYTTVYAFKGKTYNVLINGQNGQVEGDYPKSAIKIIGIIAAVILILLLIFGLI